MDGCGRRVDGGVDGRRRGARLGVDRCGRDIDPNLGTRLRDANNAYIVYQMRMKAGGERGWVWTGVDGGVDGSWRGARGRGRVRNMFPG